MPAEAYIGEIFMAAYNYAPQGFASCNGALLPISQNTALFSLIGVAYGGNGSTTFGLPNLQGAFPLGQGNSQSGNFVLGQTGGAATMTLTTNQLPPHNHTLAVSTAGGNTATPAAHYLAPDALGGSAPFQTGNATSTLATNAISTVGGGAPITTISPYQVVNYYIATQGIFPSRS